MFCDDASCSYGSSSGSSNSSNSKKSTELPLSKIDVGWSVKFNCYQYHADGPNMNKCVGVSDSESNTNKPTVTENNGNGRKGEEQKGKKKAVSINNSNNNNVMDGQYRLELKFAIDEKHLTEYHGNDYII